MRLRSSYDDKCRKDTGPYSFPCLCYKGCLGLGERTARCTYTTNGGCHSPQLYVCWAYLCRRIEVFRLLIRSFSPRVVCWRGLYSMTSEYCSRRSLVRVRWTNFVPLKTMTRNPLLSVSYFWIDSQIWRHWLKETPRFTELSVSHTHFWMTAIQNFDRSGLGYSIRSWTF